jgi:hypothetical protein
MLTPHAHTSTHAHASRHSQRAQHDRTTRTSSRDFDALDLT